MTLGELKTAVNSLGGETNLEEIYPNSTTIDLNGISRVAVDANFCSIVTRALDEINRIRPRAKHTTVVFRRPSTVYAQSASEAADGLKIPLSGGTAYTFEIVGKGKYRIGESDVVKVDYSHYTRVYGLLNQENIATGAVVAFEGDFGLTVRNAAVYADKISARLDIPEYQAYAEYTLDECDFVALDGKSITTEDVQRYGIKILDNRKIAVPWETRGEVGVRYQRKISEVTINTNDYDALDVDPDLERLLPLLVASYAYLTDDTTAKAQYYRQLYEADRAMIMREIRNLDRNNLIKTNGW